MTTHVRKDEARSRYELVDGDRVVGFADYHVDGDVVTLPHTVIDASRRGHGLGAVLVGGALDDIRQAGQRVVPVCSYVRQYLDEHPELADLRDA
jgi:predicted GNAT family acetyltransferase